MKYRKKPVVIEAVEIQSISARIVSWSDVTGWLIAATKKPPTEIGAIWSGEHDPHEGYTEPQHVVYINTLEGRMMALPGDFIIQGIKGELYPCKPDIFAATYEMVEP